MEGLSPFPILRHYFGQIVCKRPELRFFSHPIPLLLLLPLLPPSPRLILISSTAFLLTKPVSLGGYISSLFYSHIMSPMLKVS